MQVQVKYADYQSFGGINFLNDYLNRLGFDAMVKSILGQRNAIARYQYSDLLKGIFFICAIGGETLNDSNILFKEVSRHPDLQAASADTIEYAFQECKQSAKDTWAGVISMSSFAAAGTWSIFLATISGAFGGGVSGSDLSFRMCQFPSVW